MGDEGATRATVVDLYTAHYRPLLELASLLLDDRATCEEVVQDAFVAVIGRGLDDVSGPKTPAYLRSAVLNGARSHLRRRLVRDRSRPLRLVPKGTFGSPEAEAEQHDDERAVLAAVQALPTRQREVLVLRYWMDLTEAEIADALSISAGSVKTHPGRTTTTTTSPSTTLDDPSPASATTAPGPTSTTPGPTTTAGPSATTAPPPTLATPPPTTTTVLPGASTGPASGPGTPEGEVALIGDVRIGAGDGHDRVAIEFLDDRLPSWSVAYVEPPITQDGSGEPVAVAGDAFLLVTLTPAAAHDFDGEVPRPSYQGPSRLPGAGTAQVVEAVQVGDFEAVVTWAVGLRGRVPFRVTTLAAPARLVIDIAPSP